MHKLNLIEIPIKFDPRNHTYVNTINGELFTGCTTVIGTRNKEFTRWWPVKEAVKYLGWFDPKGLTEEQKKEFIGKLEGKLNKIKNFSSEEYYKVLDDARLEHTKKTKEAFKSGTLAHEWIKQYLQAQINDEKLADIPFPDDEKATNSIKEFLKWESQHQIEWLASELVVASLNHKFAGTVDWVARVDNILTLGDFKTSNQISEDCAIQLAGYFLALDEMLKEGEERPKQRIVLRIPKDGSGFECQKINTDLEFDREVFIHLREIHRWNLFIDNHFKDENGRVKLGPNI